MGKPDFLEYMPHTRSQHLAQFAVTISSAALGFILLFLATFLFGALFEEQYLLIALIPFGIAALVSVAISLSVGNLRRRTLIGLSVICLLPALGLTLFFATNRWLLWNVAPYDRFKELLASPIPASVSHLNVVPTDERIGENAVILRFEIAREALDKIIRSRNYSSVRPANMADRGDLFNDPEYLRLGEADEFYQAISPAGDVSTLRVNKAHTQAVFRYQTAWEAVNAPGRRPAGAGGKPRH